MSDLRLVFHGQETLEELREAIDLALNKKHELRNERGGRLLSFAAALPRPLLSLIFSLLGWLDGYNLVPDFIRNVIPLYCSLYLANLGAIGLPGGFHHLFDLGTASTFLVIGPLEKQPMVDAEGAVVARDCLEFYFSFDERVSDGLNIWPSFRLIKVIMRHPTLLTQPELSLDAILAYENAVTA
ncbi:MAG: hypothetical protein NTX25_20580 [Proteobacteria bacterium]|nr:hypothetical protein [Pseudomonadota bacterium]